MTNDPILSTFDELARRRGDAPLVASPTTKATRAEIHALSLAVARDIEHSAAPPGGYVLLASANGAGFLGALLGIVRAGRVPVLADWSAPPGERERIAEALGIAAGVACDLAFPTRETAPRTFAFGRPAASPPPAAGCVKMTSGSSGTPAGIATTTEALAIDDDQIATTMGIGADDRLLAEIPWSHSYALSSAVVPALRRGLLLVLADTGGPWGPLDAGRVLEATVFPTVPIYLHAIAALAETPEWPRTIRTLISAGAPLRPETAARFEEAFGIRAHVFYGASECGGICYDREGGAALRGTVGTPLAGVTVTLHETGLRVTSGAVGSGYVPVPRDELHGGAFFAADLAAWTPSGELRLLGRADALINVGGKKVHPAEIESVLRAMPGVRDVAVFGLEAPGCREIVRAVVACDPTRTTYDAVTAWCRARLAPHKVPRSVQLVDEIPRNARGKIDRAALTPVVE
ncbi:MAG TPA: class I adenylate-forming enzyme family protein [Candidatus Polarisedimenticolaceae bacterium]|nr:class I adenylate-forming enzyme family protein [Candidatus Polarisedimenticolaceae bacterium]